MSYTEWTHMAKHAFNEACLATHLKKVKIVEQAFLASYTYTLSACPRVYPEQQKNTADRIAQISCNKINALFNLGYEKNTTLRTGNKGERMSFIKPASHLEIATILMNSAPYIDYYMLEHSKMDMLEPHAKMFGDVSRDYIQLNELKTEGCLENCSHLNKFFSQAWVSLMLDGIIHLEKIFNSFSINTNANGPKNDKENLLFSLDKERTVLYCAPITGPVFGELANLVHMVDDYLVKEKPLPSISFLQKHSPQ